MQTYRQAANVDVRNGGAGTPTAAAAAATVDAVLADTLIMLIAEPNAVVTPLLLHAHQPEGVGGKEEELEAKARPHGTRVQKLRAVEWRRAHATGAN